jgi:predicted site-specific integrase-resolvase
VASVKPTSSVGISLESAISALVTGEITSMKAAVYVRVSTDRQTVQNQLADLERLAQARGYEVTVYEEVESAAKARPVLYRLLADARAGRVQAVAVWALDRLHRSMVGAIQTVLELDRLGVRVLSARFGQLLAPHAKNPSWESFSGRFSLSNRPGEVHPR